ncbi:MAG: peptidoglycan-binding protein, partial [Bdellovibrio bacteriovorus]
QALVSEEPVLVSAEPEPEPEPEPDPQPGSDLASTATPAGPEAPEATLPRVALASFAPDAAAETLARLAMPEETALRVLLRRWGIAIEDLGGGDPCARVAALGLRCERERGKLSNVRYFDRPVLLRVGDRYGEPRFAALGRLDLDYATLDLEGGSELVPVAGLESVWTGDYTVLWRPPPTGAPLIGPGASEDSVRWLRRLIAQVPDSGLAYLDSGRFDAPLTGALREFQRAKGLAADGLAGPRTLIQLHNAAGTPGIPRLLPPAAVAATPALNETDRPAAASVATQSRAVP